MSRTALFLVAASVLGFISLGPSRKPPAVAPPIAKPGSSNGLLEVTAIATHGLVPAGGGEVTAQIDVRLREAATARAKVSISLVIDRSGSMVGEKLESAKRAARAFVERLEPTDQLALVSFSSDVTRLHLRTMNAEGKRVALGVIDELQPGGGTNIGDALRAGADELAEATGNRRLVLASDGNPTVGVVASDELMRVAESIHEQAIGVTALGIGADYNASLMIGLAELGGGFYGYLSEAGRLDEVLAQELSQARATLARNVKLTLKPGAGVTVTEVPGRVLLGSQLRLPDFKQGDTARLFVRLQVAPGAVVSARELLAVEVSDVAVSSGVMQVEHAQVNVGSSDDLAAVENSKNEPAFSNAVSALGSKHLVAAAAALERGDREEAFSLLGRARAMFGTSAQALAGNQDVMADTERSIRTGKGKELKHFARALEKKTLSTFGAQNSY